MLPPLILVLLGLWASGAATARAGDSQPPPAAVARDIEVLNRLLQQRRALSSTPAPKTTTPRATPTPAPAADAKQPARADKPGNAPAETGVAELIAALDEDSKDARELARRQLVAVGAPAVPELIEALDAPELRVRIEAAEALGALKDPRAAEPLAGLLGESSRELWGAVYRALSGIGEPAAPALLDALDDNDSSTRWKAVHLLGAIRPPGAAGDLVALLNRDRSTGVRVEIASALGLIRDRTACDALIEALHDW